MTAYSLTALFQAARPDLERKLGPHASTAAAQARLRALLDRLPDEYAAEGRRQGWPVTQHDTDRIRDLLEVLYAALGAASAVTAPAAACPPEPTGRPDGLKDRLFGWGRPRPGHDWAEPEHRYGRPDLEPPGPVDTYAKVQLEVRTARYLDAAEAALEAMDRLLESSDPPKPPPATDDTGPGARWADDPQLLDLAQDLLAARLTDNPVMALRRIEHLEDELRIHQGIAVLRYQHGDQETEGLFDILPAPAGFPPEFVTRRPALVHGDKVIRRGEVRGPSASFADPLRPPISMPQPETRSAADD